MLNTEKIAAHHHPLRKIPGVLFAVVVPPPLDAPLPAAFVGDVLPRVPPDGVGFVAVVAPPRVGVVLPLPLTAAPPRAGNEHAYFYLFISEF